MIDLRVYRAAFVPALAALIVAMFSVSSRPGPVRAQLPPDSFEGAAATRQAREIVELAPERAPGSAGDAAVAELVRERFEAIEPSGVLTQDFFAPFHEREVGMRNVALVLPGASEERVALIAHRDTARGPGATSSAAATAILLEIAAKLGTARHAKTLVFVSTDGGSAGNAGARRFAEKFPGADRIEAAVVLDQPGPRRAKRPFVLPWSTDSRIASIDLVQSARAAIRSEVGVEAGAEGPVGHLLRLALPFALGEQAALLDRGIESVALSASGERPPRSADDGLDELSGERVSEFGRAALSLVLALDDSRSKVGEGPPAYVIFSRNLVPGWALAVLALAFVLPVALAAADGWARARRQHAAVLRWLAWTVAHALPFLAALAAAYLLDLVSWVPEASFPYDPSEYPLDLQGLAALAAITVVFALAWMLARPLAPPVLGLDGEGGVAAAYGIALSATAVAAWALNPYFALLLVPAVHLWLLTVFGGSTRPRAATLAVLAGLALPLLTVLYLARRLDLDFEAPWHLLLFLTSGGIGPLEALVGCLLGGCALAVLAIAHGSGRRGSWPPLNPIRGR